MKPSKFQSLRRLLIAGTAALGFAVSTPASAALTIIINNINGPGVGFNDPTPVAPVGGNTGTTLGEQRLIAFTYAANIWGANLTSSVPVVINAQFTALSCTATGAVLGSAGATTVHANFTGAPRTGTWYSQALANKLFGSDLNTTQGDINANFNVNLGNPGCLTGSFWYYGLDSNEPAGWIDFVAVLQHEMAHGLGFQTFTSGTTGNFLGTPPTQFPAMWDYFLLGTVTGLHWNEMTPAQRVASAISATRLVWNGPLVTAAAPNVLRPGLPGVLINGPASGPLMNTTLLAGEASFGAALTQAGLTGEVMPVVTSTGGGPGCGPLTLNDSRAVQGRIAVIDRGVCGFTVKVKNAQNAGAIGVLIADNVAGSPPPGLGGTDPTITIPAVRITLADANTLKATLAKRSRTASGVFARIGTFGSQLAGADANGRVMMFAPNPFQSGSSVSHYDTTATPNLLMEPSINGNLTQAVDAPLDLTLPLFKDIGW